jgi:hypothetical protein
MQRKTTAKKTGRVFATNNRSKTYLNLLPFELQDELYTFLSYYELDNRFCTDSYKRQLNLNINCRYIYAVKAASVYNIPYKLIEHLPDEEFDKIKNTEALYDHTEYEYQTTQGMGNVSRKVVLREMTIFLLNKSVEADDLPLFTYLLENNTNDIKQGGVIYSSNIKDILKDTLRKDSLSIGEYLIGNDLITLDDIRYALTKIGDVKINTTIEFFEDFYETSE